MGGTTGEALSKTIAADDDGRSPAPGTEPVTRRLTALQRRQQLFDVALRLFAERGYRATTMDDIAEAAGVTKPLLYQHFSSKRGLYLELVDHIARDITGALAEVTARAEGPRQQVELGFRTFFEQVAQHQEAFRLLFVRNAEDDAELGEALRGVEDAIAETIDPLIAAGLDPEHRRLLAYAVVGLAEGAMRWWVDRSAAGPDTASVPGIAPLDEAHRLAGRLADLAWAGLRSVHAD